VALVAQTAAFVYIYARIPQIAEMTLSFYATSRPSFSISHRLAAIPSPFDHAMDAIRRKILSERADYEKWTIKQLHMAATVTASAIAVFQFLRRDHSYSGAFVQFALKNRATVQIVVKSSPTSLLYCRSIVFGPPLILPCDCTCLGVQHD
jgi:hypothetical protein